MFKQLTCLSVASVAFAVLVATGCSSARTETPVVLESAGDFALLDQDGVQHQLYGRRSDRGVVLYTHGLGCNIVSLNLTKLEALRRQYEPRGIRVLMLNSNAEDTRELLRAHLAERHLSTPILRDPDQLVMDQLHIERTAEAILIDSQKRRIVYRGPIDDQADYEVLKPKITSSYLQDAIESLLDGRPAATPRVTSPGCLISKSHASAPLPDNYYAERVAPLLQQKCVACHRVGGVAPWAMTDYSMVKRWSAMMKEVLLTRRMPPWHADPLIGEFKFDRSVSGEDRRALIGWIDQGSPRGGDADPLAQSTPASSSVWPRGKPDYIVSLAPYSVPANGVVPYVYQQADTHVGRDVWVRDAVVLVSNQKVVHHALTFVGESMDHVENWIAAYVPGINDAGRDGADPDLAQTGFFLPNRSKLLFQVHYTPSGTASTNTVTLGLYFHSKPPKYQLSSPSLIARDLVIPPFARDHVVSASRRFDRDVIAYGLLPHMHYRGVRADFTAEYPDGRREVLLSVPKYNFNWQTIYYFKTPKRIPAGTVVRFTGHYDNSADNPLNPDPNATVRWGEQTTDEMLLGYLIQGVPAP